MPITLSILRTVLQQTSTICASEYRACMFKAMYTTAFFAFLRVGEITCCPRSSSVLQLNQIVQLVDHSGGVIGLKITFFYFKHSYNQTNVSITLKRTSVQIYAQCRAYWIIFHAGVCRMARFFERTRATRFHANFLLTI